MQTKFRDSVIIELDRPREVRASYKALDKIEQLTKLKILRLQVDLSMKQYVTMLWCMLEADAAAHNETLKLSDVEDLVDKYADMAYVIDAVTSAYNAAMAPGNPDEAAAESDEKNAERTEISSETP